MAGFSLTENPFAILGVSPRAKRNEIEDAFEDALIENPQREQSLLRVKQALLSPPTRLAAEVAWMPEVAPAKAADLIAKLRDGKTVQLTKLISELPPLTRANVAADAMARFDDIQYVEQLIAAHASISLDATTGWFRSVRATSGFVEVGDTQLFEAVRSLRKQHAASAMISIARSTHPAENMTRIMTAIDDPHDGFLADLLVEFDHWSTPFLAGVETRIEALITSVLEDAGPAVEELVAALKDWDDLSQPAQVHAQHSGLDEPRSLRIYRKVRSACVTLANDQGRYGEAQQIAATMQHVFQELPTAAVELEGDISALAELSQDAAMAATVAALNGALGRARADTTRFREELRRQGFGGSRSAPLVTDVHRELVAAALALRSTPSPDLALSLVRGLALDIHNEMSDPEAANVLLSGAATIAPANDPTLADLISNDLRILRNNLRHAKLSVAIKLNHFSTAISIVETMLPDAREERQQLLAVKSQLEGRKNGRLLKIGGWSVAGVFLLFVFINSQVSNNNSSDYPPTYDDYSYPTSDVSISEGVPDYAPYQPPAEPPAELPVELPAEPSSPTPWSDAVPPVGSNLVLTPAQLRYCAYEEVRLTAMQGLVRDDSAARVIDAFNERIDDYNSRCGSFQYRVGDLEPAKAAAQAASAELAEDARAVVEMWGE